MAISRTVVEQQINEAKAALQARLDTLKTKSIEGLKLQRDPIRKMLVATLKKVKKRLVSIEKLETQNVKRKEEKSAKLAAPKVPKQKKAVPEKGKAAKKGGDEGKKKQKKEKEKK